MLCYILVFCALLCWCMYLFVLCVAGLTVFAILLLNVMDVFNVRGGALLDRP